MGCLSGKWDEIDLTLSVFNETYYNIMMMQKFSCLTVPWVHTAGRIMVDGGGVVTLKYSEVVDYNYRYRWGV